MLSRTHCWPEGHWSWPIKVSHKHGLRCSDLVFVGGQVDLDAEGNVRHAGDLQRQTEAVLDYIQTVLGELDCEMQDLVKLIVFYVHDAEEAPEQMLAQIAARLGPAPGPVVSLIPLPALAYPGMMVEIEVVAMRALEGARPARTQAGADGRPALPAPLSHALLCGGMLFVGAQSAVEADGSVASPGELVTQSRLVMEHIGRLLAELGAGFDDAVKVNRYYVAGGTAKDWEGSACVCASFFDEPGPAATGVPLQRLPKSGAMIALELTAMLDDEGRSIAREHGWPKGHWDWPVHLPYQHGLKCGRMIYVGGQVSLDPAGGVIDPANMQAQTHTSLRNIAAVLEGFGATLDDVVKVTTFYRGSASADALHENFRIRSQSFSEPGPATTGVPLPFLAYEDMVIEIEVVAMSE